MPNAYTTLDSARDYLSLASSNESDNAQIVSFINRASRSIDKYCRRKFYPRRETRFYDYSDQRQLKVDDDLLAVDTFNTNNGASTVASSVMWLATGDNWNRPPYDRIVLSTNSGSLLNYTGTDQRANEVTGFWGYHEDWNNAWVDTGTSLAASYAVSGTSLSLAGAGSTGAGASDVNLDAPRISVGNLLKVEGEYFHVVGGNGPTQVLITPYANGTSGNNHPSGLQIYKFSPEPDVEFATLRLAGWLYGQKSAPYSEKTAYTQIGAISIPQALAVDVRDKLDRFVKRSIITYQPKA